jgi:hypothetical protein
MGFLENVLVVALMLLALFVWLLAFLAFRKSSTRKVFFIFLSFGIFAVKQVLVFANRFMGIQLAPYFGELMDFMFLVALFLSLFQREGSGLKK